MRSLAITAEARVERVRENILAFAAATEQLPAHNPAVKRGVLSICGYGPSLAETWGNTIGPVMSMSGAHDFLLEKGVIPRYHVEIDPREFKAWFVSEPHKDCTYLINSQCHPHMFERLLERGAKVVMWHSFTGDDVASWVEAFFPGTRMLGGGTTIGSRAIIVARELGHRHFELHGLDCCYRGTQQWAGGHFSRPHKTVRVLVEGDEFETSDLLMQATDDFFNVMRACENCRFRVHGGGLLEKRLQLFNRDPVKATSPGWWSPVGFELKAAA